MAGTNLLGRRQIEGCWGDYPYRLFISYSHADTAHVDAFEARLRRFMVPKLLDKAWTPFGPPPKTLKPYFRDRRSLGANHSLDDELMEALQGSAALVVFCSPNSAKSSYVNDEIRRFRQLHRGEWVRSREGERIFPIIVGGDPKDDSGPGNCFPEALREVMNEAGEVDPTQKAEPMAADARPIPHGDGDERAFYKVVAGMLGLDADVVSREDIKRENRERLLRRTRTGLGLAVAALFAVASLVYVIQERGRWMTQDQMLADRAKQRFVASTAGDNREALATALLGTNRARGVGFDPEHLAPEVDEALRLIVDGTRYHRRPMRLSQSNDIRMGTFEDYGEVKLYTVSVEDTTFALQHHSGSFGDISETDIRIVPPDPGETFVQADGGRQLAAVAQDGAYAQIYRLFTPTDDYRQPLGRLRMWERIDLAWASPPFGASVRPNEVKIAFGLDPVRGGEGEMILIGAGDTVRVLNLARRYAGAHGNLVSLSEQLQLPGVNARARLRSRVSSVAFSPNSARAAAVFDTADGVFLITFSTQAGGGSCVHSLGGKEDGVLPQALFVDAEHLALLGPTGTIFAGFPAATDPDSCPQDASLEAMVESGKIQRLASAQNRIVRRGDNQLMAIGRDRAVRAWHRDESSNWVARRLIPAGAGGAGGRAIVPLEGEDAQGAPLLLQVSRAVPGAACYGDLPVWVTPTPVDAYRAEPPLGLCGVSLHLGVRGDTASTSGEGGTPTDEVENDAVADACDALTKTGLSSESRNTLFETLRTELGVDTGFTLRGAGDACRHLVGSAGSTNANDSSAPLTGLTPEAARIALERLNDDRRASSAALPDPAIDILVSFATGFESLQSFQSSAVWHTLTAPGEGSARYLQVQNSQRFRSELINAMALRTWNSADGTLGIEISSEVLARRTDHVNRMLEALPIVVVERVVRPPLPPPEPMRLPDEADPDLEAVTPDEPQLRRLIVRSAPVRLFLHIVQEADRPAAELFADRLREIQGIQVQGIERLDIRLNQTDLRFLKGGDAAQADRLVETLGDVAGPNCQPLVRDLSDRYENDRRIQPGTLELWLSPNSSCLEPFKSVATTTVRPLDVRYYKQTDDDPAVETLLRGLLGDELSVRPAQLRNIPINMIACHPDLGADEFTRVKELALELIAAGINIQRISPFRAPDSKAPERVEILHSVDAFRDGRSVTETEILDMETCVPLP